MPVFEINPAKASVSKFMQEVAPKPTGG